MQRFLRVVLRQSRPTKLKLYLRLRKRAFANDNAELGRQPDAGRVYCAAT